jgi:hypothetical protein
MALPIEIFVLHNVDRDPENGFFFFFLFFCFSFRRYGGDRILTEEFGDMDIVAYNLSTNIIQACDLNDPTQIKLFQIKPNAPSSLELFSSRILGRWIVLRSFFFL